MDINEIRELVSQFDQSSLTEFDLREGQFELYMNKNKTSRGMNMVQTTKRCQFRSQSMSYLNKQQLLQKQ